MGHDETEKTSPARAVLAPVTMHSRIAPIPDPRVHTQPLCRVLLLALAVLLLTSVHHAYGAYIYDTPWRLHVLFVSGIAAPVLLGSLLVVQKRPADFWGAAAFWLFAAIVLAFPVVGIGLFEGGYNHAVKNALYFAGSSLTTMHRLFPPPTYELPGDVFFEVTGVMQLVAGATTGYHLFRLVLSRWSRRAAAPRIDATG